MPAATTHVEFAKDVYRRMDDTMRKEITDLPMYYVGSQGPDLLFFSNFSVFPGTMRPVGNRMHDEKCLEFLRYFEEFAKTDSALRSYYNGVLCHYALDSVSHPLINALSRQYASRMGRQETEYHFEIEGEYDLWSLQKSGKTFSDYDVYEYLKLSDEDVRKLAILYSGMLKKVYDLDFSVPKLIRAINDVPRMTRLLRPKGIKYEFAKYVESVFKAPKMLSGMMLSDRPVVSLNEEHRDWHPIFDPSATRNESFPDLYERSINLALQLLQEVKDEDISLNFCGEPY